MATPMPPGETSPRRAAPPRLIGRVLGAAFLVVLFFVAWDMTTAFLWFVGFGVFVSAIIGVVGALRARSISMLLACLAAIGLFPSSCAMQLKAMSATMRRVEELGVKAQAMCDAAGRCPDIGALCGGTPVPERSTPGRIVGQCGTAGTTVRYPIFYTLKDDGRAFSTGTRLNIDHSVSSSGGVGLTVTHSQVLDGQESRRPTVNAAPTPAPAPATTP